jgi:anti-anti-sigma regulatory factor/GAF domain-containing protein
MRLHLESIGMDTSALSSQQLLAILDVTRGMAEQYLVEPLVDYVVTKVFELIPAERCVVIFFPDGDDPDQPGEGDGRVQIARTRQGAPIADAYKQISQSVVQQTRSELIPLLVNDALDDTLLMSARSVRSLGLRSVMCVPLITHQKAIGAIYVENRSASGQFRDENLIPLMLLANQVVSAIQNARMVEALEHRVAERTNALHGLNQQLAEQANELEHKNHLAEKLLEQHAAALETQQRLLDLIAEQSTPVLPIFPGILAMPIIGILDSSRMNHMYEQLLQSISTTQAQVVLLDITGVPLVDTQVAAALLQLARASQLLGSEVILVGIRPEIAQSLVGIGVTLQGLSTRATLAEGLRDALGKLNYAIVHR